MKPAAELRQGSTYRKDNIPYLILKAERHQSTSGKRQRAAEVKFKTKELTEIKCNFYMKLMGNITSWIRKLLSKLLCQLRIWEMR